MSERPTNVETEGKKDSGKRKKTASNIEQIEVQAEIHHDTNGAKTTTTELAFSLQQGFAQISRELSKTIAESFKSFKSELEIEYRDDLDEADENDLEELEEPPAKKQSSHAEDKSVTNIDAAVAKLTDTANPNTNSSEGKFEVLNSLKQDLKREETGPTLNADPANVVNAMCKDGLPDEKLQEKMNKYHRPENCESLTKVRVNQAVSLIATLQKLSGYHDT